MSPSMELAADVCKDALPLHVLCPKSAKHSWTGQRWTDVVCVECTVRFGLVIQAYMLLIVELHALMALEVGQSIR